MIIPTRSDDLRAQAEMLKMAADNMASARRLLMAVIDLRFVMGEMTKGNGALADIIHYLGEFAEDIKLIEVPEK